MIELFELLKASLFTGEDIQLTDWQSTFYEMKEQAVATLPGEWLKAHPVDPYWNKYCYFQQGQWVRVMHTQSQLIDLLEENHIPSVIIKGAASAMYYPHPNLRTMGDVDVLVQRRYIDRAAEILEATGYTLTHDKDHVSHHYNYRKNDISIELHRRLPVIDDEDEELLSLFESGIDNRVWATTEGNRFPVLPPPINGLVLIFHINQHLRSGLGLRQIIDWLMYVNQLSTEQWEELKPLLQRTGMERLALTTTAMCQRYLGLKPYFPGTEEVDTSLCDEFMAYILAKGNFGRKAGVDGKMESFSFWSTERGGLFKRLQAGGLCQWKAAKKYPVLRPFAWVYQGFRIISILIKNGVSVGKVQAQKKKGLEQRQLIEALGLRVDRKIKT